MAYSRTFLKPLNSIFSLAYVGTLFLISILPKRSAFSIARLLGRLRYARGGRALTRQRTLMRTGLGASTEEISESLKRSFELSVCEDLECCLYPRQTSNNINELIELQGIEKLDSTLKKGRGAIIYSAHIKGLATFIGALAHYGYKLNLVMQKRAAGRNFIERWFYERRNTLFNRLPGCRILWLQSSLSAVAVQAAHALKRNEIVIIVVDQTSSNYNVEVNFCNGRAIFPRGPAVLARLTGASLLDVWVHRDQRRWLPQVAEIGAPIVASRDIAGTTQLCASRLEEKILRYPASWNGWLFSKCVLWDSSDEQELKVLDDAGAQPEAQVEPMQSA